MTMLCPDEALEDLMGAMRSDDADELQQADALLLRFPEDPRLHFLRGSILASIGRPIEAMPALRKAVELAPDFAIARFQLGFFQLTSGEAADALSTWGPLALLPEDHYLRLFVGGLTRLIRDEFDEAVNELRKGILANEENAPLNRDIQLIIDQATALAQQAERPGAEGGAASAASFLLDQFADRGRPH